MYTYAASNSEEKGGGCCPCTEGATAPSPVGSDYYCESGTPQWQGAVLQFGRSMGLTAVVVMRSHAVIHQTSRGSVRRSQLHF